MSDLKEFSYSYNLLDDIMKAADASVLEYGVDGVRTKREILEKYKSKYWYSEASKRWICYVPDATKRGGRKQVSRKQKKDIEDVVYEHYSKEEEQNEKEAKKDELKQRTFSQLFYEFMEHKKTQVKSGTIRRMMVDWKKYYEPCKKFVDRSFTEITKIDVDDFFNHVASVFSPTNKDFSNMCGIMKQTFEYAIDAGYIDKSPYRTNKVNRKNIVHSRKKENKESIFNEFEQSLLTKELLKKSESNIDYLLPWVILLDFETGLRIGEILALREGDIEDVHFHVQRQLTEEHDIQKIDNIKSVGWIISEYTKSYCGDRLVPITDKAFQYLQKIKDIHNRTGQQHEDYLFYNPDSVITEHSVKALLERSCLKVGIPERNVHSIRKTYTSRLYAKGVSVSDISRLLGHADESTTWKHYIFSVDSTEERDRKVREALRNTEERSIKKEACKSTKVNQNIIQFPVNKKASKTHKIKAF